MSTLIGSQELYDYISRTADPHVDPMLFWAAFGLSEEAVMDITVSTAQTIGVHPAQALTCMEVGAMIAMRFAEEKEKQNA